MNWGMHSPALQDIQYKEGQTQEVRRRNRMGSVRVKEELLSPACICFALSPSREEQLVPAVLRLQAAPPRRSTMPRVWKAGQAEQGAVVPGSLSGRKTRPLASTNKLKACIWWRSKWVTWERELISWECSCLHGPCSVRRLGVASAF